MSIREKNRDEEEIEYERRPMTIWSRTRSRARPMLIESSNLEKYMGISFTTKT